MQPHAMNRRQALRALALGGVGAASMPAWVETLAAVATDHAAHPPPAALQAAGDAWAPTVFTSEQHRTVTALAEMIIPRTGTAGATDAGVARFIDTVLADAPETERSQFLAGLTWLDDRCAEVFGSPFGETAPDRQSALLTVLAAPDNRSLSDRMGVEFFQAMKRLTVTGYYTSEVGMREELGDDGRLAFQDDPGCSHPEHQS